MKGIYSHIRWQSRIKNPWFWIGLCSVILTALQIDANSLTSWHEVWVAVSETISNPVKLTTVGMAVMGMLTDYSKPATVADAVSGVDLAEALASVVTAEPTPASTAEPTPATDPMPTQETPPEPALVDVAVLQQTVQQAVTQAIQK